MRCGYFIIENIALNEPGDPFLSCFICSYLTTTAVLIYYIESNNKELFGLVLLIPCTVKVSQLNLNLRACALITMR